MAAMRNLVARIRIPGAFARRSSPSQGPAPSSLAESEVKKAALDKNNIEAVDLRSNGELLAKHADKTVEAISQVIEKQQVVGGQFSTLAYKYVGSAVVFGSIHRMLDHYWKDKPDPDWEFFAALEFPE